MPHVYLFLLSANRLTKFICKLENQRVYWRANLFIAYVANGLLLDDVGLLICRNEDGGHVLSLLFFMSELLFLQYFKL